MRSESPLTVLFVCMGNICRSPSAQGFFEKHLAERGLADRYDVDSAGTHGWHEGSPPDKRSIRAAARFDVDIRNQSARRVKSSDFSRFDWIVAMDDSNYADLSSMREQGDAKLVKMMDYGQSPGVREVPDPYYGGGDGFITVCELLDKATSALLDHIESQRLRP